MSPRDEENQFELHPETSPQNHLRPEIQPFQAEEELQIEQDFVLEDPAEEIIEEPAAEIIEESIEETVAHTTVEPVEEPAAKLDAESKPVQETETFGVAYADSHRDTDTSATVIIDDADIFIEEPTSLDTSGPFSSPAREDIQQPVRDVFDRRDGTEELSVDSTGLLRRSLIKPATDHEDDQNNTETAATPVDATASDAGLGAGLATPPPTRPAMQRVTPQNARFEPTDAAGSNLSLQDSLLEGASIKPTLSSRAPGRLISALVSVLLLPLTWYVLADAGARLVVATNNPWQSGQINLAAIAELLGGLALLFLIALVAVQSALGLLIDGIILTVIGVPFVFVPGWSAALLQQSIQPALTRAGAVGGNLAYHLEFTGASGLLFICGVAMIFIAWVLYKVRRVGRKEEGLRITLASTNPEGIKARWAKKASAEDTNA